jgi:hypothetical protein
VMLIQFLLRGAISQEVSKDIGVLQHPSTLNHLMESLAKEGIDDMVYT